ncbi:MAG: PKD domain-containing protein [Saprospiraceae bacterium]|nr:PKD domain-containing protein [Saprospiraceae bacterium]
MRYSLLSLLIIIILGSGSLDAQSVIKGTTLDQDKYEVLWKKFEYFDLFQLDAKQLNSAVNDPAEDNTVILELGGYDWEMELYPNDLHQYNYTSVLFEDGQIKKGHKLPVISYSGRLKGNPASRIDITITDEMILGIVDNGRERYFIEKVRNIVETAGGRDYIIYNVNSIIQEAELTCGMDEIQQKEKEAKDQNPRPEGPESMACYDAVVALATDAGMATRHGGGSGAQSHVIGILTLVQANYDDEFQDEINFVIGAHFNATGTNPAAWNYSSIGALLSSFRSWANGNGFGTTAYDVATLWTATSFGGTIGLAYLGTVCGGSRYNVCVDFTGNSNSLRCLQAHELGHNFGLTHDASGSPHIMAPTLNGSSTWSAQSKSQMNSNIPYPCMGACAGGTPPTADFIGSPQEGCRPFNVSFTDLSSNNPTQWRWTFPGGSPATSSQRNPTVSYSTPGVYDVELEVSNNAGSDILTRRNYITVGDVPVPNFTTNVILDEVIFKDESIIYGSADYLWDFGDGNFSSEVNPTHTYELDGIYIVTLTLTSMCGSQSIQKSVEIITPPTAEFRSDTTELCSGTFITYTNLSSYNSNTFKWFFEGGDPETSSKETPTIYYDSAGVFDVELIVTNKRYRDLEKKANYIEVDTQAVAEFSSDVDLESLEVQFTNETPNGRSFKWLFGDGEDSKKENPQHTYAKDSFYDVTFITSNHCGVDSIERTIQVGRLPEAGFQSDETDGCLPMTITFEDTSSENTTKRIWKFEGGDPLSSTDESPTVSYNSVGQYKVTLIAINGIGNDTVIKEDYISIEDEPVSDFQFTRNGYEIDFENESEGATDFEWDFGDGNTSDEESPTHTYAGDGEYNVVLIVSNSCGMDTMEKEVSISNRPHANFDADVYVGCLPLSVKFRDQSSTNTESVEWIIPGGSPSSTTEREPVITFNNAGLYRVTLVAKNAFGTDTIEKQDFIEVLDVPEAEFDYSLNGFNVAFTVDSKFGKDFMWDFGDGEVSDMENPTHVYTDEGVYNITLIVSNICGSDTLSEDITVTPRPIVNFMSDVNEICIGDTVRFEDNSMNDPTAWMWTFEGGTPASSTEENPVIIYNDPGIFSVTLEASNQFGSNESVLDDYITVYDDPMATFDFGTQGVRVNFENNSEHYNSIMWDFGDGENSTELEPSHLYARPGTYTVTLTVENPCGVSQYIEEVTVKYKDLDIVMTSPPPAPNPTTGEVLVEHYGPPADNISIFVSGLDGQLDQLYQGDFANGELQETLNLSGYSEGTYFLFFRTDHEVRMEKVVIQR